MSELLSTKHCQHKSKLATPSNKITPSSKITPLNNIKFKATLISNFSNHKIQEI